MEVQMSRRERKKLQSRNKILDAAVVMFLDKGYQSSSIADIMNEADLGVGTFYNYFNSKDDILLCLLDRMALDVQNRLTVLQNQGASHREILGVLVSDTAGLIEKNSFVLPLFLNAGNNSASKNEGRHAPAFMKIFLQLVEAGQEAGEFRQDVPSGVITELIHSLFQAAAFSRLSLSFQQNINSKMIILMDGIRAKQD